MNWKEIESYNSLENSLLSYEIKYLIERIDNNIKITENDVIVERKILSIAKNYENGTFEKCEYIKQSDAYEIIYNIVKYKTKYNILTYIKEIETQINNLISGDVYEEKIIREFLIYILKELKIQNNNEIEFKRCGSNYELFSF